MHLHGYLPTDRKQQAYKGNQTLTGAQTGRSTILLHIYFGCCCVFKNDGKTGGSGTDQRNQVEALMFKYPQLVFFFPDDSLLFIGLDLTRKYGY